ncbi:quinolinate synthase NadA [Vallitalea okinawensis]|uniref:quinolinate synthase NadA n=1 Tax=Vallitalea okinawensis TaxID=2078660 RepID=UPI000CFBD262|nr:quinolinate synthase NadA [Vallitalea okinawensis]
MTTQEITREILQLKEKNKAVILAHTYQDGHIQDIADIVGDSLMLSKAAKEVDCKTIVFCGVRFMAETAKILSPKKTVLLPAIDALCPMAKMVTAEDIRVYREMNPKKKIVCYVNSTTEVKAECDVCITSANAVEVINRLPEKDILIVPDENLGHYIKQSLPHKNIDLWPGFCITHKRVLEKDILQVKAIHPNAPILVHPECSYSVLKHADYVGSTSQIIHYVDQHDYDKYIIGTEMGVIHSLKKNHPDKAFYLLSTGLICSNMKKTGLKDVYHALKYQQHVIEVDEELRQRAYGSIDKMFSICE